MGLFTSGARRIEDVFWGWMSTFLLRRGCFRGGWLSPMERLDGAVGAAVPRVEARRGRIALAVANP